MVLINGVQQQLLPKQKLVDPNPIEVYKRKIADIMRLFTKLVKRIAQSPQRPSEAAALEMVNN